MDLKEILGQSGKRTFDPAGRPKKKNERSVPGPWIVAVIGYLIIMAILLFFTSVRRKHVSPGRLVGPQACAECHAEQVEAWAGTRMARSFDALRPGTKVEVKEAAGLDPGFDYTADETCLPCHATGYGVPGGFVSFEETPEMAGVTCEACHGTGGIFIGVMTVEDRAFDSMGARRSGLVYPPSERICLPCHRGDSPHERLAYEFDFDERMARGTHLHIPLRYRTDPAAP